MKCFFGESTEHIYHAFTPIYTPQSSYIVGISVFAQLGNMLALGFAFRSSRGPKFERELTLKLEPLRAAVWDAMLWWLLVAWIYSFAVWKMGKWERETRLLRPLLHQLQSLLLSLRKRNWEVVDHLRAH